MLTENDIKAAFLKTNKSEPLSEGWPGLLRFGREVERVTGLDIERDLYLKIGELEDGLRRCHEIIAEQQNVPNSGLVVMP